MNEQKNNNDNNSKFKKFIEVMKTDKQKRAWLVLFGYFIFFFILILMIRSSPSTSNYDNTSSSNLRNMDISLIKNDNYYFNYTVHLDDQIINYEGERNGTKSLFHKSTNKVIENYYQDNDSYHMKINDIWTLSDNPYVLASFMDISKIEKILEEAKYISKTEYEDYSKLYHYQISTTTLVKLIDSEIIDLDDIPNDIMVTTDRSNNVQKIEFNLSSYTNHKLLTTSSSSVILEYTKFNEINSINVDLQ